MTEISEVDRRLEGLDHPLTDALQRARQLILGADDQVTETIKWSTPTFVYKATSSASHPQRPQSASCSIGGAERPVDHLRLDGDNGLVRTMRFANLEEVETGRSDIESAITAWCDWRDQEPE